MRVLSLTQPWATLIAIGAKSFETRSWGTSYRGPLAIHAAKGLGPIGGINGLIDLLMRDPFHDVLKEHEYFFTADFPRGAIVAVCTLAEVYEIHDNGLWAHHTIHSLPGEPERSFGNYAPGRFAWKLTAVQALREPLPYQGAQRLRGISDAATIRAIYERVQE